MGHNPKPEPSGKRKLQGRNYIINTTTKPMHRLLLYFGLTFQNPNSSSFFFFFFSDVSQLCSLQVILFPAFRSRVKPCLFITSRYNLFATSLFTIHKFYSSSFLTTYHVSLNLMVVTYIYVCLYVCIYVLSPV